MLAIPIFFIIAVERKKVLLSELGFPKNRKWFNEALAAGKIFLALIFFSIIFSVIFTLAGTNDLEPVQQVAKSLAAGSPFVLAYFFIVRVFAEEFLFRAFLVPRIGVVLSAALFGIAHLSYGSVAEAVGAFALGIILGIAYKQNKSIVPNFIAHMLYNFVAVISLLNI
ncbi:MAG TPA: CPBP family intramembrane glutamic endopeptidase [archaeon]|nr:CPBP family intramembrane glutamic endopeptidase [archaeon]